MKILITGASGQLGAYLLEEAPRLGHSVVGWSGARAERRGAVDLEPVDLADLDAIEPALDRANPAAIIHAAAISSAEGVRLDPARAELINVRATRRIAEWAESRAAAVRLHLDRPGFRRDGGDEPRGRSRPNRSWPTAGPSGPPSVAVLIDPVSAVLTHPVAGRGPAAAPVRSRVARGRLGVL